jgi:hypothetical protein
VDCREPCVGDQNPPAIFLGKRIAKVVEPEPKREEAQGDQKCDKDLIGESIHKETGE